MLHVHAVTTLADGTIPSDPGNDSQVFFKMIVVGLVALVGIIVLVHNVDARIRREKQLPPRDHP